uniref:Transcription factor Adf-1 n=1 Tax=Ceratitis capitata TaxID=7213 RepID=W8B616_CERCA
MDDLEEQKFNVRFVHTVEKYPVIYNTNLRDFKQKRSILAREEAWKAIAEKFNSEVFPLQKKWKRFRTTLQQNLNQNKRFETSRLYYLYDHLKFLIPYVKVTNGNHKSKANYEEEKEGEEEYEIVDEIDGIDQNTMSYESNDSDEISTTKQRQSLSLLEGEPIQKPTKPRQGLKRKSNAFSNGDFRNSAHSTPLSNVTPGASSSIGNIELELSTRCENDKTHFLSSLIPDLDEMSNSQMRHFKVKVLELIDEILTEN